jgi:hypothetical protein
VLAEERLATHALEVSVHWPSFSHGLLFMVNVRYMQCCCSGLFNRIPDLGIPDSIATTTKEEGRNN